MPRRRISPKAIMEGEYTITAPFLPGDRIWAVDFGGAEGGDFQVYEGLVTNAVMSCNRKRQWGCNIGAMLKYDEDGFRTPILYFTFDEIGVSWFKDRDDAQAECDRRNGK